MNSPISLQITYSESLESVIGYQWKGCCLHILCTQGDGHFLYDDRAVNFGKGDILIISYPEKVTYYLHSEDIHVELIAAPLEHIQNLMPANHYGIGGSISLYQNPVIPVTGEDAEHFLDDIHRLRDRSLESDHLFLTQLLNSLLLTMVYDLFDFHARLHEAEKTSDRTGVLVQSLMELLDSGATRNHREVAYYADRLNVSPRYLSDTVRRITGQPVMVLITRHTIPLIIERLQDPRLSLTQIASEMNFTSLNYFTRYVQKHLGMTPSEYRAAHQPK